MYNTWEELKLACENCHRCELCETRTNVVVGVGNENAEVMFIGEGPGENEDLQGEPFVGRAGKLLDKFWSELDFVKLIDKFLVIEEYLHCQYGKVPSAEEP
jgi:uracil-DNA glycosylase family 4